jgi:hypothetical protein
LALTPEGKVKKRLKEYLSRREDLYQFWPVQNGMGSPTLDVIICYKGHYLALEVKTGKKKMTERQSHTADQVIGAKGAALLINDDSTTWARLDGWFDSVDATERLAVQFRMEYAST